MLLLEQLRVAALNYLGVRMLVRKEQHVSVQQAVSRGAQRLLKSGAARAARVRLRTRVSGMTMIGLGTFLALARRET